MTPKLNRRQAMETAAAAAGAVAVAVQTPDAEAGGRVELGRYAHRDGVRGRMTGAQAAAAAIRCEGTPCVFGIPGAQNNELWDAFKAYEVPYMLVAHEFSASIMADASARATGRPGVFSVVPGPGLTNCLTGLGEALYDGIPVVAVVTDIDRSANAPVGQVHGLMNEALLRPVVKALFVVRHQAEIPGTLFHAFRLAQAGEPGPVGVVIPYPFFADVWDYDQAPPPPMPVPFDETAYQRVVCHLQDKRKRIGIYAGLGCVEAGPALTAVAEMLQAPVATSVSGKGVIADAHPLAVGWGYGKQGTRAAEKAFKDVDVVLAVGVRYSEVSTANYAIPDIEVVHVDVNPNNMGKNVPTSHSLVSDSRVFLDRLLGDAATLRRPADPGLWSRIDRHRQVDRCIARTQQVTQCVDPMFFLSQLRCSLGPEELIFVDVTASTHWASETIEVQGTRRYFTPSDNQSMGWAIPAAIGAQRVRPDRRVVCVTGDGCFLMSAMEMSTAARLGLPVKFFVFDDGAYHYMQMLQEPVFRRTTATEIARVDYAAFAAGLGVGYNQIASNADVVPGLQRSFGLAGPILTHVIVSYDGREIRWLNALRTKYIGDLSNREKIRLAARVGVRAVTPRDDSD
ncbi:thiamine pyrophosphate-binding protein [Paludisphaera mucosa]|uniref:Thiamine pyrophosphate-binding protein n=1 Tax=Paludisphaera mucosa TaxID=3030827 RepID=A0ABT6F5E9_9BACT|nr:thiamine pyrophosphate-binding protein [Paludisphaera mucosa]MDG3002802.1 thiamine pyrophosphate-binding protein [Paludisphaera mucosa]